MRAGFCPVPGLWNEARLAPEIATVAAGSFKAKDPPAIRGTGYVVDCLEAALWAFHRSDSFREGALLAVNLGDTLETIEHFLKGKNITLDVGLVEEEETESALRRDYGIPLGCPTVYLIDGAGKVAYRAVGCQETEIRAALGRLGIR